LRTRTAEARAMPRWTLARPPETSTER
jgi:hypothetical protein